MVFWFCSTFPFAFTIKHFMTWLNTQSTNGLYRMTKSKIPNNFYVISFAFTFPLRSEYERIRQVYISGTLNFKLSVCILKIVLRVSDNLQPFKHRSIDVFNNCFGRFDFLHGFSMSEQIKFGRKSKTNKIISICFLSNFKILALQSHHFW